MATGTAATSSCCRWHCAKGIINLFFCMAHHSEPSVFLCSMLIDAKMSPRMNEAKLMCGRRSAFHLVQYTWGYQDYSRLQRDLVSIMLLPWLDLIIEMVGAFQFSMELLSVLNLSRLSWRYVVAWRVFFLNAWTSNPFFYRDLPDLSNDLAMLSCWRWSNFS